MKLGLGEMQEYDRNFMIYNTSNNSWNKIPINENYSICNTITKMYSFRKRI